MKKNQRIYQKFFSYAIAFLILISTLQLMAQSEKGHCIDDAKKLCQDVVPGDAKIYQCLMENESALSVKCKNHLNNWKNVRISCEKDMLKFCKDASGNSVQKCMKQNKPNLSKECLEAIEKAEI